MKLLTDLLTEMDDWREEVAADDLNDPAPDDAFASLNEFYSGLVSEAGMGGGLA